MLEVIFHELESEWALEIVRGVERVAGQHHLAVVLSEMQGRRTPGRGWIEGVLARRPIGVIAVFSDLSETMRDPAADARHPVRRRRPDRRTACTTRRRSARRTGMAAWPRPGTCSGLGHRRIAVVGGPEDILCSRARMDGYRAAMDAAGVADRSRPRQPRRVPGRGGGRRRAARCSRRSDPPTAIIAGNDLQALGVYQAAREARLHIPEDLSVVGFDDLPVAQLGRAAADDRPPAAGRDGDRGRRAGPRDGPRRAARADPRRARHRARGPREHRPAPGLRAVSRSGRARGRDRRPARASLAVVAQRAVWLNPQSGTSVEPLRAARPRPAPGRSARRPRRPIRGGSS